MISLIVLKLKVKKNKKNLCFFFFLLIFDFCFKGVQAGGCGDLSIRFRPALIFQERHADIFLDKFREVLKETK